MMDYFATWDTDRMTIKRHGAVKKGNLTTYEEQIVDKDVPCHVYTTTKGSFTPSDTSGSVQENNSLRCDIKVDIRKGDEIIVTRFKTKKEERYIAGKPIDKCEPFGFVSPFLEHKEVPLLLKERT